MLFGRHAREFARALARGEWERTPEGVVFPRQQALLHGEFGWAIDGDAAGRAPNLLCNTGLGLLAGMAQGSGFGSLWIAPYTNLTTPLVTWTDFDLYRAGELASAPQGYTEGTRQTWTDLDEGAGVVGNTASPAVFTLSTASTINVGGFALCLVTNAKRSGAPTPFTASAVTSSFLFQDIVDSIGHLRDTGTIGQRWYDLNNDDHFDSFLGHWVDPSLDDIVAPPPSQGLFAAALVGTSALTFTTGQTLSVTYKVALS